MEGRRYVRPADKHRLYIVDDLGLGYLGRRVRGEDLEGLAGKGLPSFVVSVEQPEVLESDVVPAVSWEDEREGNRSCVMPVGWAYQWQCSGRGVWEDGARGTKGGTDGGSTDEDIESCVPCLLSRG